MVRHQEHQTFKAFTGSDGHALCAEVTAFASSEGVAAKSLGAEYLESAGKLLITLGYVKGGTSYPVRVTSDAIGKFDVANASEIEKAIEESVAMVDKVICHCPFVDKDGVLTILYLEHLG